MRRAGIYARISSDKDGEALGVARQIEDCERLAARKGWVVEERYVDNDVSAYSGRVRKEYRRLLDDLAAGVIDAVVVWHLDRLHRQPAELEEFFAVCEEAGVRDMASVTGDTDLSTADGRFMARILGAVASKESDDKSRRIKRKQLELAQAGRPAGGGTRPFGYEADKRTLRHEEAAVVRELAERFLAGESLRSLCSDLTERGVLTSTGRAWTTQSLRRMLGSARISGQREHHGEIVAAGDWPAIITGEQTARIRATLSDETRRTNRTARRYLLARLLRCGQCGEVLVARPRADGSRRYVCAKSANYSGCGKTYIAAEPAEALVEEAVLYRLDSPELERAVRGRPQDDDAAQAQREADQATAQLEELATAHGEQQITLKEWLAARAPVERRLTAARRRLARVSRADALDGHVGHGVELRERWPSLPLTRQRAIVAAVLDHAVVGPGKPGTNRLDPSRVEPIWRT